MEIGVRLKDARIARGLTLEDVETETKIRRKYITALEEEQFDLLPGKVYAKAFLKTYVRFLGIDLGEDYLFPRDVFEEDPPVGRDRDDPLFAPPPKKHAQSNGFFRRLAIGVAVLAGAASFLIIGSWIIGTYLANYTPGKVIGGNTSVLADNQANGNQMMAAAEPDMSNEEENPPVDDGRLVLDFNVTKRPCWVRVEIDGTEEFQGTLEPGDSKRFEGEKKIIARFGDAGAVEVFQNGRSLGMMSDISEVLDKEFKLQNEENRR